LAVKIITDSTSDMPESIVSDLDIEVVPLNIHIGQDNFKHGVDIGTDEFYTKLLTDSELPKTSQPSPGEFLEVYRKCLDDSDAIVSIHVTSKLSGTYNSAIQARSELNTNKKIEIIDSATVSMALGLIVIRAATIAKDGGSLEEVLKEIDDCCNNTEVLVVLDTLEYLEKGGRIGKASALIGSILSLKPILTVEDGIVGTFGKARTFTKAMNTLEEAIKGFAPVSDVSVFYSTDKSIADDMADRMSGIVEPDKLVISRIGPTVGTYAGPKAIAVAVIKK
jgi:DegV family protein with EDD domain|tara:strand:- start:27 stop:863 length:837 start_codon:yes stop_codon:yes gene_type:complete